MRASSTVNCQSTGFASASRLCCHAAASCARAWISGIRLSRHCRPPPTLFTTSGRNGEVSSHAKDHAQWRGLSASAGPSASWQGRLGNPVTSPFSQIFPARSIDHNSVLPKEKGGGVPTGRPSVKNARGDWRCFAEAEQCESRAFERFAETFAQVGLAESRLSPCMMR